jgi:hypothetical protein
MNDAYIDVYNLIFETLQELNTREQDIHNKNRVNPLVIKTQHKRKNHQPPWDKFINK